MIEKDEKGAWNWMKLDWKKKTWLWNSKKIKKIKGKGRNGKYNHIPFPCPFPGKKGNENRRLVAVKVSERVELEVCVCLCERASRCGSSTAGHSAGLMNVSSSSIAATQSSRGPATMTYSLLDQTTSRPSAPKPSHTHTPLPPIHKHRVSIPRLSGAYLTQTHWFFLFFPSIYNTPQISHTLVCCCTTWLSVW